VRAEAHDPQRPVGRRRGRERTKVRLVRWGITGVLTVIAITTLFPMYLMVSNVFRTNADWASSKLGFPTTFSFDAIEHAWTGASIPLYCRNSAIVTSGTVVLSLFCAATAGYAFSKIRWRGGGAFYLFVLSWIAVPPLILLVPLYVEMVDLGLYDTWWSVILIYTALNLPFNVYLMTTYFRNVPDEILEAAEIDGAGTHQTFVRILLPLARPALATLVIFNVLWSWNEFIFALLLLPSDSTKTLTIGVLQFQGRFNQDPTALMAGLVITSLPVIAVYLVFQRHLVRAIAAGATK
jgi:ABC-type glycerol-3-phosphate transport system permease component